MSVERETALSKYEIPKEEKVHFDEEVVKHWFQDLRNGTKAKKKQLVDESFPSMGASSFSDWQNLLFCLAEELANTHEDDNLTYRKWLSLALKNISSSKQGPLEINENSEILTEKLLGVISSSKSKTIKSFTIISLGNIFFATGYSKLILDLLKQTNKLIADEKVTAFISASSICFNSIPCVF
eukprot:TRINITY_DN2570_c0_g4_i3.p1 TRINITY_DN2570_c0_g4~~TRINITY_DN2570_c0_g4_i3.p1  ORF type:complete len:193 (-),score=37.67 TRINITY_DN2570_c0_g4_i3:368-916(-)